MTRAARAALAQAAALAAGALALYLATLAPTVLWGDDAELQRLAVLGGAMEGPRSYGLWLAVAHGFARLPLGEPAWRVNLVSACFAAVAVGAAYGALRLLRCAPAAAAIASVALALAHTFWLHAVRAEVYSLFLALLAAVVALLLLWRRAPERPWPLGLAALLSGVAALAHPLLVTALPACVALVVATPKARPARVYAAAALGGAGALLLYLLAGRGDPAAVGAGSLLRSLLALGPRDVALWLGFLGYQFLALTPVGLYGLWRLWGDDRPGALLVGLGFLGGSAFGLAFRVPDQYVFYLPAYLFYALAVGSGLSDLLALAGRRRRAATAAALALALMAPLAYRATPAALGALDVRLLPVRSLPYRDSDLFFFFPPKGGYDGARRFGEEVFATLPPDAALLVDHLPLQTLRYLQEAEGRRPDVLLWYEFAGQGRQLPALLEQSRSRPVFIADDERYYDLEEIRRAFEVRPFGPIFRLEPRR